MLQAGHNNQKSFKWVAILLLLCIGVIVYGALFSNNEVLVNSASGIGFLIGYYVLFALILWSVFYFIALRNHGKTIGFVSFTAILLSFIVASQIAANKRRSNARLLADSMQHIETVASHYRKTDNKITNSTMPPFSVAAPDKANGDYGVMQNILIQQSNQMAAIIGEYQEQITAIGWRSIFHAQRIQEDKGLKLSKQMVGDALNLVGQYRLRSENVLGATRARIEASNMDAGTKVEVLKGFDRSVGQSKQSLDSLWDLEKDIVVQTGNVFDTLGRSNGWSVKNGRFVYSDPATRDAVVSYVTRIKGDNQQEKHLREEAIKRSQIQTSKLQQELN